LKGALNEFDQPRSPSGALQPGISKTITFNDLVGGGAAGMFDLVKVAADLEAARREARTSQKSNEKGRNNKHIHGAGAEVHPLRDQAWALRRAMGGEPHQHYIHHRASKPDALSTKDLALTPSGRSSMASQEPLPHAISGDLNSPSSRRMIESFRENSKYSSVDLCSPGTNATTRYTGPSPMSVGRMWSPATNSTSSSGDMEIIEVTDSSDDEVEAGRTRTTASNVSPTLPHLTNLRPLPKPK